MEKLTLTPELIVDICITWENLNHPYKKYWLNIQAGEKIYEIVTDPNRDPLSSGIFGWETMRQLESKDVPRPPFSTHDLEAAFEAGRDSVAGNGVAPYLEYKFEEWLKEYGK